MAIRLVCGDGNEVTLPKIFFKKMSLFENPDIANSRCYVLRCKANSGTVNLVLGRVYDDNEIVDVNEDNIEELRGLCQELGFSGLDEELRRFVVHASEPTMKKRLCALEERVEDWDVRMEGMQIEFKALW